MDEVDSYNLDAVVNDIYSVTEDDDYYVNIKGFRTTIQEDVRDLLVEANRTLELNNKPALTIVLIAGIYSKDPCSSCKECLDNILKWANRNNSFDGEFRLLLIDKSNGFDDKKIWKKLNMSFDNIPTTLFFDYNQSLVDIVNGVMTEEYLETFWSGKF